MLISVVIPVYQVESLLDVCLESVVSQSYQALDIILVDDGSYDRSPQICDSWAEKDSRIRVIHQENRGSSGARNAGLEVAYGDYVFFLDSDDELLPDCIKILVDALAEREYDVVQANFGVVPPDKFQLLTKAQRNRAVFGDDIAGELVQSGFYMTAVNKLYRTAFVKNCHLKFMEGIKHEDYLWSYEVACLATSLYIIGQKLYLYKVREGSISTTVTSLETTRIMVVIAEAMVSFIGNNRLAGNRNASLYFREWLYLALFSACTKCPYPVYRETYGRLRKVVESSSDVVRGRLLNAGLVRFFKDIHWVMPKALGLIYVKALMKVKYG